MLRIHQHCARRFSFLLLAACSLVSPSKAASPDDPIGTWTLRCVPPDGKSRECVVTISRDGNGLKGLYVADGKKRLAKEVALDQGVLSVKVDGEYIGQAYKLTYQGTVRGNAMRGTVQWSYGWASGRFGFEGERVVDEIAAAP